MPMGRGEEIKDWIALAHFMLTWRRQYIYRMTLIDYKVVTKTERTQVNIANKVPYITPHTYEQ